jgi:hypothetical protein
MRDVEHYRQPPDDNEHLQHSNPDYDCTMTTRRYVIWLWLLSGVPVGLALLFMPSTVRFACFVIFVFLETGHSLSPIVLAWTHREFRRRVIYPQPGKFLLLPGLVAGVAIAVGVATQVGWTSYRPGPDASSQITGWDNPFPLLVWFYSAWNLYHFAMQDFGVLLLCTGHRYRYIKMIGCLCGLLVTYFAVLGLNILGFWHIPGLVNTWGWLGLVMVGTVSVNHWVVDIGLSSRAAKHGWVFLAGVLSLGIVGFVWMVPTPNGMMIRMIPAIIGARLGLGFLHFLYSRRIWRFSDPQVRATIGKDLLPRSDELGTICVTSSES